MTIDGASVFGVTADEYERLRPDYPLDALRAALGPAGKWNSALDIGCGTGKLGRALTALGLTVLGVEPDPRMAAIAAGAGLQAEVDTFEVWQPNGRTFDIVASGQAWHWLTPGLRSRKAKECLGRDCRLLLAWNLGQHEETLARGLAEIYDDVLRDHSEPSDDTCENPTDTEHFISELRHVGFRDVQTHVTRWSRTYSATEWSTLLTTESWHLSMPERLRSELISKIEGYVCQHHAGRVVMDYDLVVVVARC